MASGAAETKFMAADPDALSSSTRQSRVRRREAAIILAARNLLSDKGYARTTMAMIAREAGVADGTLYTYFENKDALARGVIADFYARLMQTAQAAVDGRRTTRTKLDALARNHLYWTMEERGIVEMLPQLTSGLKDYAQSDVYRLNKTYVSVFDTVVREGQATGDITSDADVGVLRDIFFGALDYGGRSLLMRSLRTGAKKADVTRLVESALGAILGADAAAVPVVERLENAAARLEAALAELNN